MTSALADILLCGVCGSKAGLMRGYMPDCEGCGLGKQKCACHGRVCGPCRAFFSAETMRRRESPNRVEHLTTLPHNSPELATQLWTDGLSSCAMNCPRCQIERYDRCLSILHMVPDKVLVTSKPSDVAITKLPKQQLTMPTECGVCGSGVHLVRAYMPKCKGCGLGKQCVCFGRVCVSCRGFFITECTRRRQMPGREDSQRHLPHINADGSDNLWAVGITSCAPSCPRCQVERFDRCVKLAHMNPEMVGRSKKKKTSPEKIEAPTQAVAKTEPVPTPTAMQPQTPQQPAATLSTQPGGEMGKGSTCMVCGSCAPLSRSYMPECRGCGLGRQCVCFGRVCAPCAGFFCAETVKRRTNPARSANTRHLVHVNPAGLSDRWALGKTGCSSGCAACQAERYARCVDIASMMPAMVGHKRRSRGRRVTKPASTLARTPRPEDLPPFEAEAPNQGVIDECAVCSTDADLGRTFMPMCRGCERQRRGDECDCYGRVCRACARFYRDETMLRRADPGREQALCAAEHDNPPTTMNLWTSGSVACVELCDACGFERYFRCQDNACLRAELVPLSLAPPPPAAVASHDGDHDQSPSALKRNMAGVEATPLGKTPMDTSADDAESDMGVAKGDAGDEESTAEKADGEEDRQVYGENGLGEEGDADHDPAVTKTERSCSADKEDSANDTSGSMDTSIEDTSEMVTTTPPPTVEAEGFVEIVPSHAEPTSCSVCGLVASQPLRKFRLCDTCTGSDCTCAGDVCALCLRFFATVTLQRRKDPEAAERQGAATHQDPAGSMGLLENGKISCGAADCDACVFERYFTCVEDANLSPALVHETPDEPSDPATFCAVCLSQGALMRGYMPECKGCGHGKQCICYGRVCAPCRRFFATETNRRRSSPGRASFMATIQHLANKYLDDLWTRGKTYCAPLCPACIYLRYERCLTKAHMQPEQVGARVYRRSKPTPDKGKVLQHSPGASGDSDMLTGESDEDSEAAEPAHGVPKRDRKRSLEDGVQDSDEDDDEEEDEEDGDDGDQVAADDAHSEATSSGHEHSSPIKATKGKKAPKRARETLA